MAVVLIKDAGNRKGLALDFWSVKMKNTAFGEHFLNTYCVLSML
jgi:hypothetical protein